MHYEQSAPLPELAPFLECIWTLEGHADSLAGEPQAVLPDGRPELVLHFGDAFDRLDLHGDGAVRQPWLIFAGQLTSQLLLRPTGKICVLGLRFHPFGAAAVIDRPQSELAGLTVDVDDLSPSVARKMEDVRRQASGPTDAAILAQHALLSCVEHRRLDPRVVFAVQEIDRCHGQISIDRLAVDCGLTRRHLERRFQEVVGMSPKRLARIARFQRAVGFLEGKAEAGPQGGAVTAAACGYADQAHFIRDFRDLAGCAPTEHLLNKGILTGFFTR